MIPYKQEILFIEITDPVVRGLRPSLKTIIARKALGLKLLTQLLGD